MSQQNSERRASCVRSLTASERRSLLYLPLFQCFKLMIYRINRPIHSLSKLFVLRHSRKLTSKMSFQYPQAYRDEAVDDYHGVKVPDPYSWLEDPDSEKTQAFVNSQNQLTLPFLEQCEVRDLFKERMTELYDYPKYSCPFKRGSRYFHFYNTGLQNQSVMYVQESLDAEPTVFLDPNKFSDDGTVALRGYAFSEDGEYLAYGTSASGSDWVEIHFLRVEGAASLDDHLERVKFSCMSWTHDGKGLFYNSYPEQEGKSDGTETSTNLHQKLYFHVLGTPQSEDVLCAEFPDYPKWMCGAEVSDDGRYVLLSIREGCDPVNRLWYCDLQTTLQGITGLLPWVKLIDNFDAEYDYVTNEGTLFTFKTNLDAPRYRLLNIDFASPDQSSWTELIPQHDKDVIGELFVTNYLFVCFLHDVKNILKMYRLSSGEELRTFPLDVGSVVGFTGRKRDSEIFYYFTSFLSPAVIYHCDLTKEPLQPHIFREVTVKGFNPSDYQTTQIFFPSKDGTQIPMFVVHKKGIKLDGSHPGFLYGYGGFNISITPSYSVSRLIFVRHLGGVLAVANIRGGGEYGETWHKAGMLASKQNCFTDFQCAAEYLIKEGYTSPSKLTINGGSNGGLLVAACVNQRPELFGCAVAQVGVMDMLKFHKFTIGHAWTTDFGCSENKEQFDWLIKYSPLHNIRIPEGNGVQYPSVLLLTGDHDDRVVPLHSLKYIATLQHIVGRSPKQTNPLFILVDTKSGHGAGKPTSKVIQEVADTYAFIARCLSLSWVK
uniref:Prolyl endopeptidase n=1 Tax=Nothobranchius furzeri TaxID=105023 RepID=A0A8C6NTX8_NOTFU